MPRARVPLTAALVLLLSLAIAWLFWPRAPPEFEPVPRQGPWPTPPAHGADVPDEPQMHRPESAAAPSPGAE
jgi:hypothetical protein